MICTKHSVKGCRCKTAPTPKAPQNSYTKNQRLAFRKFKATKGKKLFLSDWPAMFKRMRTALFS